MQDVMTEAIHDRLNCLLTALFPGTLAEGVSVCEPPVNGVCFDLAECYGENE